VPAFEQLLDDCVDHFATIVRSDRESHAAPLFILSVERSLPSSEAQGISLGKGWRGLTSDP
jgi:hypothetical protein